MTGYHEVYASWKADPEMFWANAALDIDWYKSWHKMFDPYMGEYGCWFAGAECNTAYNCLDRHVAAGRGSQLALIYDSPLTGMKTTLTFAELTDKVAVLAGVLKDLGVGRGDRVLISMPMVPEAAMAMLAAARIGAIHTVVHGDLMAGALAAYIDDAQPRVILAASCVYAPDRVIRYKPLLDEAIALAQHKPAATMILQRPEAEATEMVEGRDYDWAALTARGEAEARKADCVAVKSNDPLYILYAAHSTGQPSGIVRDNGGHMVAMHWAMRNIYNTRPGEVYWAAADIGSSISHSYLVYAPLLAGCTTLMYEGEPVGTPDAGAFWRVIGEHKVATLFTTHAAMRAIMREDPDGALIAGYDLSDFNAMHLAVETGEPGGDIIKWAEDKLGVPVIDQWWQAETGWPICANPFGADATAASDNVPNIPMPGYDLQVLNENATPSQLGEAGMLAVKLPLPPGCLSAIWNSATRLRAVYLAGMPGYYSTFKIGYEDADGYIYMAACSEDAA